MSWPKSRGGPSSFVGSALSLAGAPIVAAESPSGSVGAANAREEVKLTRAKLRVERLRVMANAPVAFRRLEQSPEHASCQRSRFVCGAAVSAAFLLPR